MADKGENIIIVKRKKAGGHGHHGGAWKVAYADFVTAMMAFFLVMWLMGSDEETKAAIAHYFNHPNTPYQSGKDPISQVTNPLGEKQGDGDTVLNGQEGAVPDDLTREPIRAPAEALSEYRDLRAKIQSELETVAYGMDLDIESLKFSIGEDELFAPNGTSLKPEAKTVLSKVGKVLKKFPGYVTIEGHTDGEQVEADGQSAFEFSLSRAVSVMRFLTVGNYMNEERILPVGMGGRKTLNSNETAQAKKKNRRIEFTLSRTRAI